MSDATQPVTPYSNPLPDSTFFQTPARNACLQFAHQLLVYILRRPDNQIKATRTELLLRRFRSVNPEYLHDFYENLSGLVSALTRYVALEESCTKSGAYKQDLASALARVTKIIDGLETEEDQRTLKYLEAMLH